MGFIVKLLGLDNKAKGFLVGYRTYIVLGVAVLLNLGPALIDLGTILGLLSGVLTSVLGFTDGQLAWSLAITQIKAQFHQVTPLLAHINICLGAVAGAYAKSGISRHLAQAVETAQATQGPKTVAEHIAATITDPDLTLVQKRETIQALKTILPQPLTDAAANALLPPEVKG